jgi:flagellar basal-body rod protein FlgC
MVLFGFIIFAFNISCAKNNDVIIAIRNENNKDLLIKMILNNEFDVEIIDNGNHLTIKNSSMDMWLEILDILRLRLDVISNNIANAHTTHSKNGKPYVRQLFTFTVENGVEIIDDIASGASFVYDPSHPDAIMFGERQGYVQYPNIDIIAETLLIIETQALFESIASYLRNNYKNVIF